MTNIRKVIGARLQELRELRRVSREDLAAALDTTVDEIAAFEAGARIPPASLMKISLSLSVTVQALFIGSGDPVPEAATAAGPPSAEGPSAMEGHDLVKAFVRIRDPRLRAALIEIADYMASPEGLG